LECGIRQYWEVPGLPRIRTFWAEVMIQICTRKNKSVAIVFLGIATVVSGLSCNDGLSRKTANNSRARSIESRGPADEAMSTGFINDAAAGRQPARPKFQAEARFANYFQTPPAEATRRIIYEAQVSLVVKKMAETEAEIARLLKQFNGYVADASVDRRQGHELTGRWKVRVPAPQFDAFLEEVSKLGIAENRQQTAQDVTEEFVDLEAQITNKKRLEERIVALLQDASGKIKDVIEVERELARVRGEIEQMEGKLRYLTNRTDLTTVSITAREEENYVPPAAPTFVNRITQAWSSSLTALQTFGEKLVVATVAAAPWVVAFGVVLVPAAWYARRRATTGNRANANQSQVSSN
jgi:hypothetical protein